MLISYLCDYETFDICVFVSSSWCSMANPRQAPGRGSRLWGLKTGVLRQVLWSWWCTALTFHDERPQRVTVGYRCTKQNMVWLELGCHPSSYLRPEWSRSAFRVTLRNFPSSLPPFRGMSRDIFSVHKQQTGTVDSKVNKRRIGGLRFLEIMDSLGAGHLKHEWRVDKTWYLIKQCSRQW